MASFWDGMTSRMEGYRSNQQAKKSGKPNSWSKPQ